MNENGGSKVMGIRQIVRLKEFLQKWQSVTLGPKPSNSQSGSGHGGISQAMNNRLSSKYYDSDDDSCDSPGPPPDIRTGHLAVYVGPELRRFIIPTSCLSHSLFKVLLEKAEEEFGFDHSGGLTIPCEIETFKYLLQYMENHPEHHADDNSAGDSPATED